MYCILLMIVSVFVVGYATLHHSWDTFSFFQLLSFFFLTLIDCIRASCQLLLELLLAFFATCFDLSDKTEGTALGTN